jgi:hypothetical protein
MENTMTRKMDNAMPRLPTRAQSIIANEMAAYIRDAKQIAAGFAAGMVAFIAILNWL